MIDKRKVPEIRFKGFEGEWVERKLSDVASKIGDGLHGTPHYTEDGGVYFINGNNLICGSISTTNETMQVSIAEQSIVDKLLDSSTILMSINGTIGNLALYQGEKVMLGKSVAYISIENNHRCFIYTYLQAPIMQSRFLSKLTGTTIKNLGLKTIRESELWIPEKKEQAKIADYFQNLDSLITLHQRKHDKLTTVKKAMLEKMFPKDGVDVPEIRFKGFAEKWERRTLGEIAEFSKGSGYSKSDLSEHGTPIILYGRLYTKYQVIIDDVDTFVIAKNGSVYSKGHEVIVPASGETAEDIARASAVAKAGILLGGDLNVLYPNESINPVFLALSISNGEQCKELSKKAKGKSVVHIHNSDLKEVSILYPSVEEQSRIGSFFQNLDSLITLQQRELDKLKNIKKACLEKMFV